MLDLGINTFLIPDSAAASILAKTYRDDYMNRLHEEFPYYDWDHNKGYPTKKHRAAIDEHLKIRLMQQSDQ